MADGLKLFGRLIGSCKGAPMIYLFKIFEGWGSLLTGDLVKKKKNQPKFQVYTVFLAISPTPLIVFGMLYEKYVMVPNI